MLKLVVINDANNINTNSGSTMADLQDNASINHRPPVKQSLASGVDTKKVGMVRSTSSVNGDANSFYGSSNTEQEPAPQTQENYFIEAKKPEPTSSKKDDYIQAFIDNKIVRDIVPQLMNWTNIAGNIFSFSSWAFGFSDASKKFAKGVGSFATKSFLVATSVINVIERLHTKNYLSALGYFNDIIIAGTVDQETTYLARGIASGTYNMANSLNIANDRTDFASFEDHLKHLVKGYGKFFKNLFSADVVKNFIKSENGMWATIGGLFANLGALSWMFTGKIQLPTFIRDFAGIVMDIEQLNFGHYKEGRKDYFKSGLALVVGTVADWLSKLMPAYKDAFVPLTFIFDGIGKHWLRLHQNEYEMGEGKVKASREFEQTDSKKRNELFAQQAA